MNTHQVLVIERVHNVACCHTINTHLDLYHRWSRDVEMYSTGYLIAHRIADVYDL